MKFKNNPGVPEQNPETKILRLWLRVVILIVSSVAYDMYQSMFTSNHQLDFAKTNL